MTSKPKLSVHTVINKSFIAWGIKNDTKTRVYYKWELEKRTAPLAIPCVIVDYDKTKREWYINFIDKDKKLNSCTIDDINGSSAITSFNFIN